MNPLPGQVGGRACQREGDGENPAPVMSSGKGDMP